MCAETEETAVPPAPYACIAVGPRVCVCVGGTVHSGVCYMYTHTIHTQYAHPYTHPYTCTYTRTYIHTYTHTHIDTYTHTYTYYVCAYVCKYGVCLEQRNIDAHIPTLPISVPSVCVSVRVCRTHWQLTAPTVGDVSALAVARLLARWAARAAKASQPYPTSKARAPSRANPVCCARSVVMVRLVSATDSRRSRTCQNKEHSLALAREVG